MGIDPVFSPDKLRKEADDSLPGQVGGPRPPLPVRNENRSAFEKILDSKLRYRKLVYRVKWIGGEEDPAWHPALDPCSAGHRLQEFHNAYPTRPGPPERFNKWLRAWETGHEAPLHPDDDFPA